MNITDTVSSLAHDVSARAQDAAHAAGDLGRHAVDAGRSNLQAHGVLAAPKRRSPWATLLTLALIGGIAYVSMRLIRKGSGDTTPAPASRSTAEASRNGSGDTTASNPAHVA